MAAKLFVEIGAKIGAFQNSLNRIERDVNRFSRKMDGLGRNLTQAITLPLVASGGASLSAFANYEKLEKGLIAVTGSAEAARIELEKLKISAQAPGLGFEEAVKGSIRLQAVGFSADEARSTLETFGAAIAATGGNAQNLDSVQYQLTQMISKNRILQQDFGILQENVPLLGKALDSAFGTNNLESIRATGVSAREFNLRVVEALRNLPELQNVTGGLGNSFDNFRDSVKFSLAELGRAISESINLEGIMNKLSGALQVVVGRFQALSPQVKKTVVVIAAIVAGIGPLLLIAAKLSSLIPVLITGFNALVGIGTKLGAVMAFLTSPIGLVLLAITALTAAVIYAYNEFEGFRRVINGVISVIVELGRIAKESFAALVEGFGELSQGNFRKAAAKFKEGLIKSNPVGIAFTEGQRLGQAFAEGFADDSNRLNKKISGLKKTISSATSSVLPSLPDFSPKNPSGAGGPGLKPEKFIEPINAAIARLISNSEISGKSIKRDFSNIQEAAAQLAAKTRPALQSFEIMPNGLIQAREELELIGDKLTAIGAEPADILNAKMAALKKKIQEAVETFGLFSPQVKALQEELKKLEETKALLEPIGAVGQAIADIISGPLQGAFEGMFTTVIEGGKNAFSSFIEAVKKLVIQLAAAVATAVALATIFSVVTGGPFGGLLKGFLSSGRFGGLFSSILKGAPGAAQGGIVPPGYPNDTYFARLSSQEAIIPLSKLGQIGGATVIGGEFTIRGTDLVLAVERNQTQRRRSRGI